LYFVRFKIGIQEGKRNTSCALHVVQDTYFSDNYCAPLPVAAAPYVWEVGQVVYFSIVNEQTGSGNRYLSELRACIVMNVSRLVYC
jgi:hypothetical protein